MLEILFFPFKALAVAFTLFCFFTTTFLIYPILLINPAFGRKLVVHVSKFHAGIALYFLGVHHRFLGEKSLRHKHRPSLIVCNHQSYIDILLIASRFPSLFVTSMQMKETPFLGHMSILSGCIFVERRDKSNLHNEVRELTENLKKGINVLVFPEATCSNGEAILRFRRPLFQAAIDAQAPILPLCLNYKKINGEKVTKTNKDKILWYGKMPFVSHAMRFLCLSKIEVDFNIMHPLQPSPEWEKGNLAETTQKMVEECFFPMT
jgi:1-acyl-sn-glycerol-3-phosphate acyltransferase